MADTPLITDPDRIKISVTKMDVVRGQLRAAIQLWFNEADPVAIHTLVFAAHEILHTLYRRKGLTDLIFDSRLIKDDARADWARQLKASATFFKHAQRDPDATFEFWPFLNEMIIMYSVQALSRMGEPLGFEESAFTHWAFVSRPDFVTEGAYSGVPVEVLKHLRGLGKREFLEGYAVFWAQQSNPAQVPT